MAESVQRYNRDDIPLYLCVPSKDLNDFKAFFEDLPCRFITDEGVLEKTARAFGPPPNLFPTSLNQQLIKLEFWRLGLCANYVWIDSDHYFIKPFTRDVFLSKDAVPYTVQHNAIELRSYSEKFDQKVIRDFEKMASHLQGLFQRSGALYNFGYPPLIWSSRVLTSLYEDYLKPSGKSIYEVLYKYPCEMHLYGEYLHASNIIPILPIEPLFKVYHYPEMFYESQMLGESEQGLAKDYYGLVMQSNWTNISESKKNDLKRLMRFVRRVKRKLGFTGFDKN
ncbi:MAG: hypothetical protein JEZ12_20525 [Desulfobacterium sp.]|nr:hypothetical protein [Desulfobacterium sp.]